MVVEKPRNRRIHRLAFLLTGAISLGLGAHLARAQVDAIPAEITASQTQLNPSQVDTVKKYADRYVQQLTASAEAGEKLEAVQKLEEARRMLQGPLAGSTVSPAFRLAYTRQLADAVKTLLANSNQKVVINTLSIAGDLATDTSVDILDSHLTDPDPSIRRSVAGAVRRTFEAVVNAPPAVGAESLIKLLDHLGEAIKAEKDPEVTSGMAEAVLMGLEIAKPKYEAVRGRALSVVCDSLGTRVRQLEGVMPGLDLAKTLISAASRVRDMLGKPGVDPKAIKDAAGFAGDLLVVVRKAVGNKGLALVAAEQDAERLTAIQISQLSEQITSLALKGLAGNMPAIQLSNFLRAGTVADDAKFAVGVQSLVDETLTKAPLGLAADRFK